MMESIDRFELVDMTLISNTSYSLLQDTVIAVFDKRTHPACSAIFTTISVIVKDKVQNSAYCKTVCCSISVFSDPVKEADFS